MIKVAVSTDREIKETFKKDKEAGFRLLYYKYSGWIMSVCKRYSADNGEAMDFFQEAMIKINDKIGSFKSDREGALKSWITRITTNLILDQFRKRGRLLIVEIDGDANKDYIDPMYEEIASIPVEELLKMVERLSESKKIVFNMFAIDGYSYKEIAGILGISEDGVSSTMSKARKHLGKMIKEYLKENTK